MAFEFAILVWIPSVGLSSRRDSCSVLHEVHKFIAWSQSPNFVLIDRGASASRASRNCGNRPFQGLRRHLGGGAVAAKITANVWEIIQLSNLVTPLLYNGV